MSPPAAEPPGYGSPGYGPVYPTYPPAYDQHGYTPPPPPPPPRPAPDAGGRGCCLWSLRLDPFDLIWRRATIEGEVAWGKLPFSTEVTGSWIFDSPADNVDESGFDVGLNIAWYPQGKPLQGFWVKAHVEYENFGATLSRMSSNDTPLGKPDPELCDADSAAGTCSRRIASTIVGLMLGSTHVFGKNGGFAISGGIGIGVALAGSSKLGVLPCTAEDVASGNPHCSAAEAEGASGLSVSYYHDADRVRLLGSLALGVAF